MAVMDMAFKALTAGLGVTTLYLAATFSVNVYRGLAWHSEQSGFGFPFRHRGGVCVNCSSGIAQKLEKEKSED